MQANCRGSYVLGTACGKCVRCRAERLDLASALTRSRLPAPFTKREMAMIEKLEMIATGTTSGSSSVDLDVTRELAFEALEALGWPTVRDLRWARETTANAGVDRIDLQNAEFAALDRLVEQHRRLAMTPVVDDDYPAVRHDYEGALSGFLKAAHANGRSMPLPAPEPALVVVHESGGVQTAGPLPPAR